MIGLSDSNQVSWATKKDERKKSRKGWYVVVETGKFCGKEERNDKERVVGFGDA